MAKSQKSDKPTSNAESILAKRARKEIFLSRTQNVDLYNELISGEVLRYLSLIESCHASIERKRTPEAETRLADLEKDFNGYLRLNPSKKGVYAKILKQAGVQYRDLSDAILNGPVISVKFGYNSEADEGMKQAEARAIRERASWNLFRSAEKYEPRERTSTHDLPRRTSSCE